ncbi:hypothetical protein [Leifsonia sp. fls2-241-R2A-40a]|uniref:hypothetical protein n=1 Tax=Leifsonia sp. fls2-241-R2A-40a TaxID=3040290 RepID=UPI00254C35E6|nr:hypothetical protein [Leifsonia sp. fls2-241-R2A-40a]
MTDTAAIQEQLRALLDEERGLRELLGADPSWYSVLIRQLELAVGDDRIIYLGAAAASALSTVTLRIGIFTDHTVVAAEVIDDGSPDAQVITRVESRADLLRFELSGGTESANSSEDSWQGGFRIRAFYQSGLIVTVPANVVDTEAKRVSVHAVLDGIRADLHATPLTGPMPG